MALCVCSGAKMKCSQSQSPDTEAALLVLPPIVTTNSEKPLATTMDFVPMLNIPAFGQCKSATNPLVIANKMAPAPCIPMVVAPWSPGAKKFKITQLPALLQTDKCMCLMGGEITIADAGQTKVNAT
jgi:hypothetical protein